MSRSAPRVIPTPLCAIPIAIVGAMREGRHSLCADPLAKTTSSRASTPRTCTDATIPSTTVESSRKARKRIKSLTLWCVRRNNYKRLHECGVTPMRSWQVVTCRCLTRSYTPLCNYHVARSKPHDCLPLWSHHQAHEHHAQLMPRNSSNHDAGSADL